MKRILLLLCGIMLVPVIACSQHLVEVGKGYSCTSVNTTVFRNNSLVTHGDEQYISYYGSSSNLVVISFLFQLSSSFLILLKVVDMFAF